MKLWVFDLDGTLITSGIDYARAVCRWELMFIDRMEHRAPHYDKFVPEFLNLLRESEKELFKTMRAHRERFPTSMVAAYRGLCRSFEMDVDPEIERETWEIGVSALSEETYRNRGMMPGAEETLKFLQERGDLLYCVTAGDPVVQWMKWRGYNLRRFFPSQREYRVGQVGQVFHPATAAQASPRQADHYGRGLDRIGFNTGSESRISTDLHSAPLGLGPRSVGQGCSGRNDPAAEDFPDR